MAYVDDELVDLRVAGKKYLRRRVRYLSSVLAETQRLYRETSAKLATERDEVRRLRDDLEQLQTLSQPAFAAARDINRAEALVRELRTIAERLAPEPEWVPRTDHCRARTVDGGIQRGEPAPKNGDQA